MLNQMPVLYFLVARAMSMPHNLEHSLVNAWEKSGEFEGDIKIYDGISARNARRSGLWPGGIVPFEINPIVFKESTTIRILCENIKRPLIIFEFIEGPSDLEVIQEAMRTIEKVISSRGITDGSCQLMFVPREPQHPDYIYITTLGPGICWSFIGVKGGPQNLSLGEGCILLDAVIHELMHALGFAHQQSAHNRDDYVTINWQNVEKGQEYNFQSKDVRYFTDFELGYDYESIMQYSAYAFSREGPDGQYVGPTMTARDPSVQLTRNEKLSEMDKMKLQLMYCKQHTEVRVVYV